MGDRILKKFFAILLMLCVLVATALVVLPSFIDWNAYRSDLAAMLSRAAGQQVAIDGGLEMALLPSPHLNARDVRIANVRGASEADLARVGEIRMQIAVGPLFSGRVSVSSLLLVEPVVNLETLPDGRGNWEIAAERSRQPSEPVTLPALPVQFSFEKVSVANGTLSWRGADDGTQRLEKLNAQIAMADLAGPLHLESSASYRDLPFTVKLSLGKRSPAAPAPFNAQLSLADGAGNISLSGTADWETLVVEGKASVASPNAADFAAALAGEPVGGMPPWPLDLEAPVRLTAEAVETAEVAVRLGKLDASGTASVVFGDTPLLKARLDIASLNIDEMLAETARAATPAGEDAPGEARPARIPGGTNAEIELAAKILRWKGGIVRDVGLTAKLEDGVLTVERAGAQLPGGTTVTLSGQAVNEGDAARFDGDLAAISDNLRAALVWSGIEEKELPADRLRAFSYTSRIAIVPESINLAEVKARLDATRITGAAVIARRERPSFGVSLDLDRIDLDAYLARRGENGQAGQAAGGGERGFPGLDGFDANFDLAVGNLTWREKSVSALRIDAQLFKGELALRDMTAGDLGGASLAMSGTLHDLAASPRAALKVALDGRDAEAFAGFVGLENTAFARRLGRFAARGQVTGNAEKANIDATLDAAGGRVKANGTVSGLDGDMGLDLAVSVSHADGDRILALAMPDRRAGKAGPLEARMRISGGADALSFREISGNLGSTVFSGTLEVALAGERPDLQAELSTGVVMLDRLFPPQPAPAASAPAVRGSARWSREPIDLEAMRDFDLRLMLRAEALVRRDVRIDGASLRAAMRDGVATVEEFTGSLFGGSLRVTGRLDAASAVPAVQGVIAARDVDSRAALEAVTDFARFKGPVSLDLSLNATGRSEIELVSSLAGAGAISGDVQARLKEDERAQAGAGALLGIVLGDKVSELGAAGDAVVVLIGAFAVEPAALSGDFAINKGVARTENLLLDGKGARAVTVGSADIANWTIDSNTAMYRGGDGSEPYITLGLRGPLDAPDIRTGGSWLKRRPEPAAPQQPAEPAAAPEARPLAEPEPKKPPKPEDFIQDILKSLQ